MKTFAKGFFKTTFGFFGDLFVIIIIGIFFTISPQEYTNGIVNLIPQKGKAKTSAIIHKTRAIFKKWRYPCHSCFIDCNGCD
jgi:predicted PurR-regulated permease PerM